MNVEGCVGLQASGASAARVAITVLPGFGGYVLSAWWMPDVRLADAVDTNDVS